MSVWIREVLAPFSLDTLVISPVQHKNSTEFDLQNVRKYISITILRLQSNRIVSVTSKMWSRMKIFAFPEKVVRINARLDLLCQWCDSLQLHNESKQNGTRMIFLVSFTYIFLYTIFKN